MTDSCDTFWASCFRFPSLLLVFFFSSFALSRRWGPGNFVDFLLAWFWRKTVHVIARLKPAVLVAGAIEAKSF